MMVTHEAGHAVVARLLGVPVEMVVMFRTDDDTSASVMTLSAAGPFSTFRLLGWNRALCSNLCLTTRSHGDDLALVDAHFPAVSMARRLVRLDGADLPDVLAACLQLMPLDTFVPIRRCAWRW